MTDISKHMNLVKFDKKYLVWQAICSSGLNSDILIATRTVNEEVYKCLTLTLRNKDRAVDGANSLQVVPKKQKHARAPLNRGMLGHSQAEPEEHK